MARAATRFRTDMTTDTITGRDLYLRYITHDGRSYVQQHRAWDADRFIAAQQEAARKLREKSGPGASFRVEVASAKDYRRQRGR